MVLLERPVPVWAHGLTHGDGGKRAGETELGMVWYGMVWYGMVWYGILEFNVPLNTDYTV